MRDHLLLYINGRRHEVAGRDALTSLSDYLRLRLNLCGTKIVCSEGDCGSCTVLVGRPDGNRLRYRPIDSCIQWMFQLDGTHIVTVEGLSDLGLSDGNSSDRGCNGHLTPVQNAMVDCHGSQCGFCTPGFVVAMTGLLEERDSLSDEDWRTGLTGNLCRCTGYVPILDAGRAIDPSTLKRIGELYADAPILSDLRKSTTVSPSIEAIDGGRVRHYFGPSTLTEAVDLLQKFPTAKIVAGATDVGVQLNKGIIDPATFIDLNRVAELTGAKIESTNDGDALVAGARTTWTEIESLVSDVVPEFQRIVAIFGSPQIRHAGTIGGNIINASPIADSIPFLMVTEAELELHGPTGPRSVPITNFYQGYKKFDLRPGELLARIRIPLPKPDDLLRLMKVSRRRDLDIATFIAAIWMRLEGDTIAAARIAFGAVGPIVLRARRTEEFLVGKPFDEDTMRAAGDVAASEVTPISDVRGSAEYRYQLTRNALLKFYLEQALAAV